MDSFMHFAIEEAKKSLEQGGIPTGAVLLQNDTIIARGHNNRVQENNPILHAEMDCLKNAGRIGSYKHTILYSTSMPCYLCAGAIIQFKIPKVIVGESLTFPGAEDLLRAHGVEVVNMRLTDCTRMMHAFIASHTKLWYEDIGRL